MNEVRQGGQASFKGGQKKWEKIRLNLTGTKTQIEYKIFKDKKKFDIQSLKFIFLISTIFFGTPCFQNVFFIVKKLCYSLNGQTPRFFHENMNCKGLTFFVFEENFDANASICLEGFIMP